MAEPTLYSWNGHEWVVCAADDAIFTDATIASALSVLTTQTKSDAACGDGWVRIQQHPRQNDVDRPRRAGSVICMAGASPVGGRQMRLWSCGLTISGDDVAVTVLIAGNRATRFECPLTRTLVSDKLGDPVLETTRCTSPRNFNQIPPQPRVSYWAGHV